MSTAKTKKALMAAAKDFLTANASIDTTGGTVAGLPTIPAASIGWENRLFEPAEKNPWASVFYRPNIPTTRTLGPCGSDQITGFVQIDFNIAPNGETKTLTDWEEKGRIYFHPGRFFTYSGQSVIVASCGMSAGRHVDNFYRKSLTIAFRSYIKRSEVI
jgi:hypothetical protein